MAIDVETYYQKYFPMVLRRCRRMLRNEEDALDAAQEVFTKLANASLRIRGDYPSSLLYVMATNTCLNLIRQRKNREGNGTIEFEETMFAGLDQSFDKVEAKILLENVLAEEKESTKTICFMYHVDRMTYEQIAKAMGLSISGVRKRLVSFSTRAKLRIEGEPG